MQLGPIRTCDDARDVRLERPEGFAVPRRGRGKICCRLGFRRVCLSVHFIVILDPLVHCSCFAPYVFGRCSIAETWHYLSHPLPPPSPTVPVFSLLIFPFFPYLTGVTSSFSAPSFLYQTARRQQSGRDVLYCSSRPTSSTILTYRGNVKDPPTFFFLLPCPSIPFHDHDLSPTCAFNPAAQNATATATANATANADADADITAHSRFNFTYLLSARLHKF